MRRPVKPVPLPPPPRLVSPPGRWDNVPFWIVGGVFGGLILFGGMLTLHATLCVPLPFPHSCKLECR